MLARPSPLVEVGSGSSSYGMGGGIQGVGLTYLSMTTAGVWVAMIARVGAAHESGWFGGGMRSSWSNWRG